jgi:hypothetical protein
VVAVWSQARDRPPYDQSTARRLDAGGGARAPMRPRTLANPLDTQRDRYPGAANDGKIIRDRTPAIVRPFYIAPGNSWVNWTEAGPVRSTLRMMNGTYRAMAGNDNTRNLDPRATGYGTQDQGHGLHTTPRPATARTIGRYRDTTQMAPPRADRLSQARYNGQSYSQTTAPQGGG